MKVQSKDAHLRRIKVVKLVGIRNPKLQSSNKPNAPVIKLASCASSERNVIEKLLPAKPVKGLSVPQISISEHSGPLLKDVAKIFKTKKESKLRTRDLISALCADKSELWATYNRGSNIAASQLAALLRPFGIKSHGFWFKGASAKGYKYEDIKKAYRTFKDANVLGLPCRLGQSINPIHLNLAVRKGVPHDK